jgi:hypothetical protein
LDGRTMLQLFFSNHDYKGPDTEFVVKSTIGEKRP